ncbi:MAG TPA: hypothetical protein DEP11_04280 [Candidatus Jacksonbacteria bacterium]|nr:hypothetical protein [Candidatus Jacksonbacteria bacterium]
MHKEILTDAQIKLLPMLESFAENFGLVGGTAIALHIGHRRSVDFDLFTNLPFDTLRIRKKIVQFNPIEGVLVDESAEYSVVVQGVKVTFLYYPFKIEFGERFDDVIQLPDLATLAAMKAYALGRRAKWKDYVDMYFIFKKFHALKEVVKKAEQIFAVDFNEKLFRVQLAYFDDMDYTEKIMYMPGFETSDETVKKSLIEYSLEYNEYKKP